MLLKDAVQIRSNIIRSLTIIPDRMKVNDNVIYLKLKLENNDNLLKLYVSLDSSDYADGKKYILFSTYNLTDLALSDKFSVQFNNVIDYSDKLSENISHNDMITAGYKMNKTIINLINDEISNFALSEK